MPYSIKGANKVEYHVLDNGLNVYIFYIDNRPIDYWISNEAMFVEKKLLTNSGSEKSILKYSGANCMEYRFNNYFSYHDDSSKDYHLITLKCNQDGMLKDQITNNATLGGGRCLMIEDNVLFPNKNDVENNPDYSILKDNYKEANLIDFVNNSPVDSKIISDTNDIMSKVNELNMKKSNSDKKNLLNLLGRNMMLSENIKDYDAFKYKG